LWKALKRREFAILDLPHRATAPPCSGENGSRKKYYKSQDQRMAVGLIPNEIWKSKMEILKKWRKRRWRRG
jgi:hypothetical protein